VLEFARPDQIILTNVDLKHADKPSSIQRAKDVVLLNHSRGKDELVHRGTKEFGTEKMPCKRFLNDVCHGIIPTGAFNYKAADRVVHVILCLANIRYKST
jgi:hypothetical protein